MRKASVTNTTINNASLQSSIIDWIENQTSINLLDDTLFTHDQINLIVEIFYNLQQLVS